MPDYKKMFQQLADAYNDRDPDAFAAHWNSDCEWHPVLARPEGDPGYYGHKGIHSWFEDVNEMYEYVKFQVYFDELRQIGDCLLVRGRMNAKGRGSGAEVTSDVRWVLEPRGEKFQRAWGYMSYDDARRAAEEAAA
ncbi:MAG: nuclear transport factor 2 family protein [Solirubrobacterales bacterium]